jgi:hypothetical protein
VGLESRQAPISMSSGATEEPGELTHSSVRQLHCHGRFLLAERLVILLQMRNKKTRDLLSGMLLLTTVALGCTGMHSPPREWLPRTKERCTNTRSTARGCHWSIKALKPMKPLPVVHFVISSTIGLLRSCGRAARSPISNRGNRIKKLPNRREARQ